MAYYYPNSREEMLQIKGVGAKKYGQYGEKFLAAIQAWPKAKNKKTTRPLGLKKEETLRKRKQTKKEASHLTTYTMFTEGNTIEEIAQEREITSQTVANHLFKAYKEGKDIRWDAFFTSQEEALVLEKRQTIKEPKLKPLKEALPEAMDYTTIRAVLVKNGFI